MPWVKLSDDWYDDPKVIEAADDGGWLWVVALSWSARNLTDGMIPRRQLPRLTTLADPEAIAARLVEIGLFAAVDGGWQIANYHEYQPTREAVLARRKADSDRKANGRTKDSARSPRGIRTESTRPGPVPVPIEDLPREPVDNSAVDNPQTDDLGAVLEAVAELRTQERAQLGGIADPAAYRAKVLASLAADEDVIGRARRAVATYDLPVQGLAEVVEGRRNLKYVPRLP